MTTNVPLKTIISSYLFASLLIGQSVFVWGCAHHTLPPPARHSEVPKKLVPFAMMELNCPEAQINSELAWANLIRFDGCGRTTILSPKGEVIVDAADPDIPRH